MASNILDSTVTYASLIDAAATSLYNLLKNESVPLGNDANGDNLYRNNSFSFTVGAGVTTGHKRGSWTSQQKTITISEKENRAEGYTTPTKDKIVSDINTFMSGLGIPTGSANPKPDGIVSFFFALNFFVEKAVIKRAITAPNNAASTYHIHYKAPSASSYNELPYFYTAENTITTEKINDIYGQLKNTSLLSDNARETKLSSTHTSCSSSSSCSSVFIAYFNLS